MTLNITVAIQWLKVYHLVFRIRCDHDYILVESVYITNKVVNVITASDKVIQRNEIRNQKGMSNIILPYDGNKLIINNLPIS